jgi:nucleoid DNA-binding protein
MATVKRKTTTSTKKTAKKTTTKGLKKSDVKVKAKKLAIPSKPYTKSELFSTICTGTGLQRKEVSLVFEELGTIIAAHLNKQGPSQFTIPGLMKITVLKKPATKARKGISPFTGEEMVFKAKPARNVVKVRALKKLKAMV